MLVGEGAFDPSAFGVEELAQGQGRASAERCGMKKDALGTIAGEVVEQRCGDLAKAQYKAGIERAVS